MSTSAASSSSTAETTMLTSPNAASATTVPIFHRFTPSPCPVSKHSATFANGLRNNVDATIDDVVANWKPAASPANDAINERSDVSFLDALAQVESTFTASGRNEKSEGVAASDINREDITSYFDNALALTDRASNDMEWS
uniref:Peroxisomal membrane protein PEX14 n=1 Tax=Panagrellus redivivus TaxID=6233 RepID=A0A7E4VB32_PANRE